MIGISYIYWGTKDLKLKESLDENNDNSGYIPNTKGMSYYSKDYHCDKSYNTENQRVSSYYEI